MCELFAMSSAQSTSVTFSLNEFRKHGCDTGSHCDGWGLAYFDKHIQKLYKEPEPAAFSKRMASLLANQPKSRLVLSHIRKATQGERNLRNTQPFIRKLKGQQHIFIHNGNLKNIHSLLTLNYFIPEGETDSEFAFCFLMEKMQALWQQEKPTVEKRIALIKTTFDYFSNLGPANFIYSDGDYLYAYANRRIQANRKIEPPGLHYLIRSGTHDSKIPLTGVTIGPCQQPLILFASVPLSNEAWKPFAENQLMVAKYGKIVN